MTTLRIEHGVADFEVWKQSFDQDPLGREKSGVRRYKVMRGVVDPQRVVIDLDFDSQAEAAAFETALREMWARVRFLRDPRVVAVETVEEKAY